MFSAKSHPGKKEDLDIQIVASRKLADRNIADLLSLFDETYREANHPYLISSLDLPHWVAMARDDDKLVGFAIGHTVHTNLPRFDAPQTVALAGISCINANYRRAGLFSQLAIGSLNGDGLIDPARSFLLCGRMAHPASYRAIGRSSRNTIPTAGQPITPWHRETIIRIAELYGVKVDPDTARVIGKGKPIGYPRIEIEATDEERQVFAPVDRDRGDSLLAISWAPQAPAGWLQEESSQI